MDSAQDVIMADVAPVAAPETLRLEPTLADVPEPLAPVNLSGETLHSVSEVPDRPQSDLVDTPALSEPSLPTSHALTEKHQTPGILSRTEHENAEQRVPSPTRRALVPKDSEGVIEVFRLPSPAPATQQALTPTRPPTSSPVSQVPPMISAAPSPQPSMQDQTDRPLNVTDALSYLDNVKLQFFDRPNVYNHFLDIMKDFKSQIIDTPGVIERVSTLFTGHPNLIQGFNTFLPVGYRIECSTDAFDVSLITVTTPTGTMTQTTAGPSGLRAPHPVSAGISSLQPFPPRPRSTGLLTPATYPGTPVGGAYGAGSTQAQHLVGSVSKPGTPSGQRFQRSLSESGPTPAEDGAYSPSENMTIEPALQYVQKIKARFADDPETYHQFLEILSHYQAKPSTMNDAEVVASVARLFKNAPDLLMDFRVFLPENTALFDEAEMLPASMADLKPDKERTNRKKVDPSASSSGVPQKRKRKPVEKEKEVYSGKPEQGKSKKLKHHHNVDTPSPSYSQQAIPASPRRSHAHGYSSTNASGPTHTHSGPHRRDQESPPTTHDERAFFDRVKRALDSRETYTEFLKLLNLFTQNIIDTPRLVQQSHTFLGDGDLMRRFKDILGWDDVKDRERIALAEEMERKPVGVLDRHPKAGLNIKNGPSYRRLPPSEANVTCSGRDEMCKSVLNDEWVSHPTWASEDAGFFTHKKNAYEEALHRSEEERHEYDFYIEAAARTLSALEPMAAKIAQMPVEERNAFKLKPNLGGSGKSVHHRVIKKIYGREAGLEVIQAMQDSPAIAIPVVVQRLKQKEVEWKRAQREWNKVWREVDARNYLKSLDHRGITFKAADKKAITMKAFVSEIEAAKAEQTAKRAALIDPLFARTRPRHQLAFVVGDVAVLQDAVKLVLSFLDRTQAQLSFEERRRVEGFLRKFVPTFFMLDVSAFNAGFVVHGDGNLNPDPGYASDEVTSVGGEESDTTSQTTGTRGARSTRKLGGASGDLRKRLLKSEQAKSTSRKTRGADVASPPISRLASPAIPDQTTIDREEEQQSTRTGQSADAGSSTQSPIHTSLDNTSGVDAAHIPEGWPRRRVFFTNTIFYTLLRLVELLYSRLFLCKNISLQLSQDHSRKHLTRSTAETLGFTVDSIDETTDDGGASNAVHIYNVLLESCEKLFDNEIEQPVFEDRMRLLFGPKHAYNVFTIDKLIGALIKQVQLVLPDKSNTRLLESLYRQRKVSLTSDDQIQYRRDAERVVGPDENLFRIDFLSDSKTMTVRLIGKDDDKMEDSEALTGRWQNYVDSYVSGNDPGGTHHKKLRRPFLRRNLPATRDAILSDVVARSSQEVRVCIRTYRLFYVANTEDCLWRNWAKVDLDHAVRKQESRSAARKRWLENFEKPASAIL